MDLSRSPSNSASRRPNKPPVFCVGWHAFVNSPKIAGTVAGPVPACDMDGHSVLNDLADGQEVEIVSWRPRGRDNVAYHIRRRTDGGEWWLSVQYLRRFREPPPADAPPR